MKLEIKGAITALVTPFINGKVDFESLKKIVRYQIQLGIQGFVISGTTGESPTLTDGEVQDIFNAVKEELRHPLPLIVGVGTNNTVSTIEKAKLAQKWGADGVLVVVPYYNKPPQRGLIQHFQMVADSVEIPNILYNVPGRTITALDLESIKVLSDHSNIVAIKEASGNIDFAKKIKSECGSKLTLLSGDDESYENFLKAGGEGIISVASHILVEAFVKGSVNSYLNFIKMIYRESNPIPIKMALYLMGLIESPECRLPLVEASEETRQALENQLKKDGFLP